MKVKYGLRKHNDTKRLSNENYLTKCKDTEMSRMKRKKKHSKYN